MGNNSQNDEEIYEKKIKMRLQDKVSDSRENFTIFGLCLWASISVRTCCNKQ